MAMPPEQESELIASAISNDPAVGPLFHSLTTDPQFEAGWQSIDVPRFSEHLSDATGHLQAYLQYQQRQERLWAIKIGSGRISPALEDQLKRSTPAARDHFTSAFSGFDACLADAEAPQFKTLVNTHIAALSARCALDEGNVFGRTFAGYTRRAGFTPPQVAEFRRQYASIGHDFIGRLGQGDVSNIRPYVAPGVSANIEIMNHTEQHGLDYIRGSGPPAWAVTASGILALFGISISAWVIVAIIAVIAVTLAFLCWAFWNSLPGWAQAGCVALATAGLIAFTF